MAEDWVRQLVLIGDPWIRSTELLETEPIWLGAGKGGQSAEASQVGQLLLLELLLLQPLEPWESLDTKLLGL